MLVLTRKIDEQILIGDDIKITVIKIRNNQIRLGISAPRDVRVLRGELEPQRVETVVDLDLEDAANLDAAKLLATAEEMEASYRPAKAQKPAPAETPIKTPQSGQSAGGNRIAGLMATKSPTVQPTNRITESTGTTGPNDREASTPSLSVFSGKLDRKTGEGQLKRSPLGGFFTAP